MATRGRRYGEEDWEKQLDEGSEEHAPAVADLVEERKDTEAVGHEIDYLIDILDYAKRGRRSYIDEGMPLQHPTSIEDQLNDLHARTSKLYEKRDREILNREIEKAREDLPSYWAFYIESEIEQYGYARAQTLEPQDPRGEKIDYTKIAQGVRERIEEDLDKAGALIKGQLPDLQVRLDDYEKEPRAYLARQGLREMKTRVDQLWRDFVDYFCIHEEQLRFKSVEELKKFAVDIKALEKQAQEVQKAVEAIKDSDIRARYEGESRRAQTLVRDMRTAREGYDTLYALKTRLSRVKNASEVGLKDNDVRQEILTLYAEIMSFQERMAGVADPEVRLDLGIESALLARELQEVAATYQIGGLGAERETAQWLTVLELPPDADSKAIRKHYLELIKRWHPDVVRESADKTVAHERTVALNEAYAMLKRAGLV